MPLLLVVGASRGLGLEFVRQYRAAGWRVAGTYRADPAPLEALGAEAIAVDVNDPAAAAALAQRFEAIDLLILNAGIYGPRSVDLAGVADETWLEVMRTNVVAPARLAATLAPAVARGQGRLIAFLSSRMGSMTLHSGGSPIYRSSKAALNSVVKGLSIDLAGQGVRTVAFHPGWVRTDMGGPSADIDPVTSVAGMRRVLEQFQPAQTGAFFNYSGDILPW